MNKYSFFQSTLLLVVIGLTCLVACNKPGNATDNIDHNGAADSSINSVAERTQSQTDSPKVYIPRTYSETELEKLRQIKKRMDAGYVKPKYSGRSEVIDGIHITYRGARTKEAFEKQRAQVREQIRNKEWPGDGKEAPSSIILGGYGPHIGTEDELRAKAFDWSGLRGLRNIDSTLAAAEAERTKREMEEREALKIKRL